MTNDKLEAARTGNWFSETPLAIARLDKLARDEDVQALLRAREGGWDLVICDEAHKMSASFFGGEVRYTKRYRLGQMLSTRTRHFPAADRDTAQWQGRRLSSCFMALLDGDRFEGRFRDGVHTADVLRPHAPDGEGKVVQVRCHTAVSLSGRAYAVPYKLSDGEARLYEEVTDYVREEFNRAEALQSDKTSGNRGVRAHHPSTADWLRRPKQSTSPLRRRKERLESRLRELQLLQRGSQVASSSLCQRP